MLFSSRNSESQNGLDMAVIDSIEKDVERRDFITSVGTCQILKYIFTH